MTASSFIMLRLYRPAASQFRPILADVMVLTTREQRIGSNIEKSLELNARKSH